MMPTDRDIFFATFDMRSKKLVYCPILRQGIGRSRLLV